ncbi:MAG: glycerophosphodiester phosphodiesterase, partial [Candidatus Heimdallarchaeaceae archaeon]
MGKTKLPLIIAHRGASGERPENTLESFSYALSSADVIETDLQLTADKKVVAFHDTIVDRVFNKKIGKRIKDYKLAELQAIDVGSWFNANYSHLRIPTLEQILDLLSGKTSLILEVKCKGTYEEKKELVESIIQILEQRKDSLGAGYISVRDLETYSIVKSYSTRFALGLMQKKRKPVELIEIIEQNDIPIAQIRWRNWTEEDWKKLQDLDVTITAFYADELKDFEYLIKKRVDGIFT